MASAWAISFFLSYQASHALAPGDDHVRVLGFRLPSVSPRATADLVKAGGLLLEVFVNPLYLVPWSLPVYVVVVPVVLWLLGAFSLGRRHPEFFLFLIFPSCWPSPPRP